MNLRTLFCLALAAVVGCEQEKPPLSETTAEHSAGTSARSTPAAITTPSAKNSSVATQTTDRVASNQSSTVGHVRVSLKKITMGKVPLKETDGTLRFTEESRLMIAVKIENIHEKRPASYNTWVPDLEAAKTVAKLSDDAGTELKRITFGFGNNVKDRTVLDTLTPGKAIGDLLVFEQPGPAVKVLNLDLPGANCGQRGTFQFRIEMKDIAK